MTEITTTDQTFATWMGRALVAIAALGVLVGYRGFTKVHAGPIYILEILFLAWAGCASLMHFRPACVKFCRLSYPTLLFTLWGILLFCCDLIAHRHTDSTIPFSRIAQHALTFVYPTMWTLVGYWCFSTGRSFTRFLALTLMVCNALPSLYGQIVINIAVGPLISLPFILLLHRLRWIRQGWLLCVGQYLVVLALGYFTFLPFWKMWITGMQRTSFLILLNMMIFVPWILKTKEESFWRCLNTTVLSFAIFISGIAILTIREKYVSMLTVPHPIVKTVPEHHNNLKITAITPVREKHPTSMPAPQPIKKTETFSPVVTLKQISKADKAMTFDDVFGRFYHPEDYVKARGFRLPEMRTRRHMWKSALAAWRTHPVFGVGFIPEVPSEVEPGIKNDGGFELKGAPPVSGPHNSYLSILARAGLVGFLLFAWMVFQYFRQASVVRRHSQPVGLFELLLFFVPLNGAIHALLNVGFESPPRAMLMWLFLGMMVAQYASYSPERCES